MQKPFWRQVVTGLMVPEASQQWTVAVEWLTAGKVMKIEVVPPPAPPPAPLPAGAAGPGTWRPSGFAAPCSPDGDFLQTRGGEGKPLLDSAPRGALIARIGGSTADQTADAGTSPSRVIFSVGRFCVFTVPASPAGALFLGVNEVAVNMSKVEGQLEVNIFEAL